MWSHIVTIELPRIRAPLVLAPWRREAQRPKRKRRELIERTVERVTERAHESER